MPSKVDKVKEAFDAGLEDVDAKPPEITATPAGIAGNDDDRSGGEKDQPDENPAPRDPDDPGPDPGSPAPPYDAPPPDDPHDPFLRAAQLPLNDFGNGQRYDIHFGEDVIWVPRVGWFTWSGKSWVLDKDALEVRRRAQKLAELIEKETQYIRPTPQELAWFHERREKNERWADLVQVPTDERTEEQSSELTKIEVRLTMLEKLLKSFNGLIGRILTHAKNAGNNGPLGHMLTEAQTLLAVELGLLDADPLTINTQSGALTFRVIDASDDGGGKTADWSLAEHHRDQLLTKIVPARFNDVRPATPLWDAFLERVMPDPELRAFLQRWFGLCMTGLKSRCFLFFYGDGANGKSVMVDTIARVLGSYATTARVESLTGSNRRGGGDATPDLVPLMGARFVRTSEPDRGTKLQEGLIKELTGGEPLLIRGLHQDFVEYLPIFKLVMSGNHKPDIRGTDDGIWDRILLVPFTERIPPGERDLKLIEKLVGEADGILAWMADGLIDYLESGLQPPAVVVQATQEYRDESDPVGTFLTECCVVSGDRADFVWSSEMTEAVRFWQMDNGAGVWQNNTIVNAVIDRAGTKDRLGKYVSPTTNNRFIRSKSGKYRYLGIRFTEMFQSRFDRAPKDTGGRVVGVPSDERERDPIRWGEDDD